MEQNEKRRLKEYLFTRRLHPSKTKSLFAYTFLNNQEQSGIIAVNNHWHKESPYSIYSDLKMVKRCFLNHNKLL